MTSNDYVVMDKVSDESKTITVEPGSNPFMMSLKRILASNGWTIEVFAGAKVTTIEEGIETESDTFNTKYVLTSDYNYGKDVVLGDFLSHYSITIIDVETRSEVLLMNGNKMRLKAFESNFEEAISELSN